ASPPVPPSPPVSPGPRSPASPPSAVPPEPLPPERVDPPPVTARSSSATWTPGFCPHAAARARSPVTATTATAVRRHDRRWGSAGFGTDTTQLLGSGRRWPGRVGVRGHEVGQGAGPAAHGGRGGDEGVAEEEDAEGAEGQDQPDPARRVAVGLGDGRR